jgi:ankyrin repeat protein
LGKKDNENRLESYKIYINSLYVALTRGVKKLYILEKNNHKIFELLNVVQEEKEEIIVEQSSNEEWEEEALKLEKLGKVEQVEEIRKKRLENIGKKIVINNEKDIFQLKEEALNPNIFNKKAKDAFFKMVKEKNQLIFIEKLAELKYIPAVKYLKNSEIKKPQIKQKKKIEEVLEYAHFGNIKQMKKLIIKNADLNLQNDDGVYALMFASYNKNKEMIELLLDNGANPNLQARDGSTTLMDVSESGSAEIVKLLLDYGANVNLQSKDGGNALMLASQNGYKEIVELLLDYNADVNIKKEDNGTALMLASNNGHKEIVRLLLENGAE